MLSTTHQRPLFTHLRHHNPSDEAVPFNVGGLNLLAAMDKIETHDTTRNSGSSGSGFSDLSALENETDEFGRRLLQHQRDARCVRNAIRPGKQAFRKARPRPRLAERLEQQERVAGEGLGTRVEEQSGRTGSGGSQDSEPPLNLPRQWGRKAKRRQDWARMAIADDGATANGELVGQRQDGDAIIPHRTAYTGDEDWIAVADEPLASIETTPPSMRRQRPQSTPSSMNHMNTTLAPGPHEEDPDFTAASLLESTPAVNRRSRKIDELTRREIETIEKRGVAKRTLEQILEQSASTSNEVRPVSAPAGATNTTSRAPRRRRSLIANKENVPPKRSEYKSTETVGLVNHRTAEAVTFKNAQRPAHMRSDSYNLLKRLARVSSMSPSPAKDASSQHGARTADEKKLRRKSDPEAEAAESLPLSAKSTNSDYVATERSHTSAGEEGRTLESRFEAHRSRSTSRQRRGEVAEAGPEAEQPHIDVTPAPHNEVEGGKTPVVTGSYPDTPAALTDVRPLLKASDSAIVRAFGTPSGIAALEPKHDPIEDGIRRIASEPGGAKSALADVLSKVRDGGDSEVQIGEATMASLEDIVNPAKSSGEEDEPTVTIDVDEVVDEVVEAIEAKGGEGLTQAQKDRRQEKLAIEAMNKHLRAARTSIKDADRGLRRVEHQIDATPLPPPNNALPPSTTSTHPEPVHAPKIDKHGRTICPACGGTYYGSVWRALAMEFLQCFALYDPTSILRVRFTWLGLACTTLLLYAVLESVLCSVYCHNLYAEKMRGYGVNPDAPGWPFVIPTLAFRPFRPFWQPGWEAISAFGSWVFAHVDVTEPVSLRVPRATEARQKYFGDSWAKTATAATAAFAASTRRVVSSAAQAVDEVGGSIWDDEMVS